MKAAPLIGAGIGFFVGRFVGTLGAAALIVHDASDGTVSKESWMALALPLVGMVAGTYAGYRIAK